MKTKNLTIQEAIQSGLPFKLPDHAYWQDKDSALFHKEWILRIDWEIKVPEVTITREKLAEAIIKADKEVQFAQTGYIDFVAKELGV